MAIFPKVQSPCPYKSNLAAVMDGDMCRMCKRQVVDLSPMTDTQRLAFMAGCAEEVCVSYRLPVRVAAAAAVAVMAVAAPMAAAAQDVDDTEVMDLIVGGIKDLKNVQYIEDKADKAMAELPVVYEDEAAQPAKEDQPAAKPAMVKAAS